MGDLDRDPLGLGPEELRELGYRTVDLLVDQLTDPSIPAMRRFPPGEVRRRLSRPPPEQPRPWPELLQQTADDVLAPMSRLAHPGYFAFIPASSTFPGALGDLIASALDIDAGSWMAAAGPSQVELVVLDWFKEWIGYPAQAAGILVSGGSAANVTALACAREALLGPMSDRVVAYTSDQSHSSVARAARLLGFRPDQVRILPTDGEAPPPAGCADRGDRRRRGRRAPAPPGLGQRRLDQHRGGRPARRAVGDLPGPRHVAARRRRLRRVRGPHRTRARPAGRPRAGRLGHARPAQVALSTDRVRMRPRPGGSPPEGGVHDQPRLSRRLQERGGQLRGSRAPAHADVPGTEDLAVVQLLRDRRVPPGDRPVARPGGDGRASGPGDADARAPVTGDAGDHLLPPAGRRRRTTRRRSAR